MSVTLSSDQENLNVHCRMVFCPDGITPNSGLTGPNNIYIYIYIYIYIWNLIKNNITRPLNVIVSIRLGIPLKANVGMNV